MFWACAKYFIIKMASHNECMESAGLLPLEHSTGVVWKFFGFPSRDGKIIETDKKKRRRVYCKLCRRNYSYVGNTSNTVCGNT